MEKFCVFCGATPQSKNKEHILPQWLIKMTGDPKREIKLGRKWNSESLDERKFSFTSFTFPACEACNTKYAEMEGKTKFVVEKILAKENLDVLEIDLLLDWLDKVRTGIWLSLIYLNGNWRGLLPLFHIEKRISSKDRMLIIYEIIDDGMQGVSWIGTESPIFQLMPSCFGLGINNFLFFNASTDFMFSQKFGFPYTAEMKYRSGGGLYMSLQPGTCELQFPFLRKRFKTGGTQIFQPMIPWEHIKNEEDEEIEELKFYDVPYVRCNCIDYEQGKGKIFLRDRQELREYPTVPSSLWVPKQKFKRGEAYFLIGKDVCEFLEELYRRPISYDKLTPEEAEFRRTEREDVLELHKTITDLFLSQKETYFGGITFGSSGQSR